MLRTSLILAVGLLAASLALSPPTRAEDSSPALPISCANGLIGGVNCIPTKEDLKHAQSAFDRGVKLHRRAHLEEALAQFDEAARLAPQNVKFLTAREVVKAKLVFDHIEHGNLLLYQQANARAAAEFRAALDLDPENQFAQERLQEATRVAAPSPAAVLPERLAESQELHLEPTNDRATFHF